MIDLNLNINSKNYIKNTEDLLIQPILIETPNNNTQIETQQSDQRPPSNSENLWEKAKKLTGVKDLQNINASYLGTFVGMVLGCSANLWNNKSFFSSDKAGCYAPFNGFRPFAIINEFRENDFQSMRSEGIQGIIKPTPFNIIYPMVHVLPSLSFLIWNVVKEKKENETNLQIFKKFCSKIPNNLIYPSFHSASLFCTSLLVGNYVRPYFNKFDIDVSGHAWYQISLTIHAINSLNRIHEHGTIKQKKIYALLNAAIAITDIFWAYNTAANCHSVADIVSGAGVVCLSHFGLQIVESALIKGVNVLKDRVTKLPLTNKIRLFFGENHQKIS